MLAPAETRDSPTTAGRQSRPAVVGESRVSAGASIEKGLGPEISADDLHKEVGYLASEQLQGRMTGSTGAQMAADYIARYFERFGVKPLGNSFFQNFEFTAGVRVLTNDNHLSVTLSNQPALSFEPGRDFQPLSFTANGDVEGTVVFVGYGLSVPGKNG